MKVGDLIWDKQLNEMGLIITIDCDDGVGEIIVYWSFDANEVFAVYPDEFFQLEVI
jgi:hypothetical protein